MLFISGATSPPLPITDQHEISRELHTKPPMAWKIVQPTTPSHTWTGSRYRCCTPAPLSSAVRMNPLNKIIASSELLVGSHLMAVGGDEPTQQNTSHS